MTKERSGKMELEGRNKKRDERGEKRKEKENKGKS